MPIDLVSPPALITRRPARLIFIDGIEMFTVIEYSVTRGLDQDLATAQITLPAGVDQRVRKFSQVDIYDGANNLGNGAHSFNGYVVDFQAGLWPGTMVLQCEDPLALAKAWYNPTDIDQHGKSDTSAVREVLETVGFDPDQINLGGVGKKIGKLDENSLLWEQKQSALARIQEIDSVSLGWRTYALTSGFLVRRFISLVPTSNYVHHFQEGVDILEGSMSTERVDPSNQIVVQGQGVKSLASNTSDAKQWRKSPYWARFKLLKVEATDVDYLSTEEVSAYILGKLGKWLLKVDFSTHLDILFQTGESVKVTSSRLEVDQVLWIQTVTRGIDSRGVFTQTFTCVSELTALNRGSQTPLITGAIPLPGTPLPPPPITPPLDPSDDDVLVDIGFAPVLAETVIIADANVTIYDVSVTDNSTSRQGTIVSRAWTITGGSPYPTSSTEKLLTFTTTDLAACSVQLDVVDSNGSTGTLTRSLSGLAAARRYRKLYTAATDVMEAYDGAVWRTAAASSGNVVGVAPGPLAWNDDNPGLALYTADDLATAPDETTPFAAQAITSEWIELDVSATRAAAGGSGGSIAISTDGATTWTERAGPSSDPVLRVFISRYNPNEIHLLTANGYYVSTSGGASWTLRLAAAGGETFIDLCLSHTRNLLASSAGVRNVGAGVVGALLTGITAGKDVYSIQPHIRLDRFFAIDEDGNTWIMATDGATAFTAGAALPATAEPEPRGMWRDGTIPNLVYIAAGNGGLWKSVDGLATSSGYYQLRKPSTLGAGAGPWLMVGAGQLAAPPTYSPPEPGQFFFVSTTGEVWSFNGTAWSHPGDFPATPIIANAYNETEIFGADSSGNLMYSSDGGATWNTDNTPPGGTGGISGVGNNSAGDILIGYNDGTLWQHGTPGLGGTGVPWIDLTSGSGPEAGAITLIHGNFNYTVFVVGSVERFAINNTQMCANLPQPGGFVGAESWLERPATNFYLDFGLVGATPTIYVDALSGAAEQDVTAGTNGTSLGTVGDVGSFPDLWVTAESGGGLVRTTDNGGTWGATGPGTATAPIAMRDVSCDMMATDPGVGMLYSTDAGATWTDVGFPGALDETDLLFLVPGSHAV